MIKAVVDKLIVMYEKAGIRTTLKSYNRMCVASNHTYSYNNTGISVLYQDDAPRADNKMSHIFMSKVALFERATESRKDNLGSLILMKPEKTLEFYPIMDNILMDPKFAPPLIRDSIVLDFLRLFYTRDSKYWPAQFCEEDKTELGSILSQVFEPLHSMLEHSATTTLKQFKDSCEMLFWSTPNRILSASSPVFRAEFLSDLPHIRLLDMSDISELERIRQDDRVAKEIAWVAKLDSLDKAFKEHHEELVKLSAIGEEVNKFFLNVKDIAANSECLYGDLSNKGFDPNDQEFLLDFVETAKSIGPDLSVIVNNVTTKINELSDILDISRKLKQEHEKSFADLRIYSGQTK